MISTNKHIILKKTPGQSQKAGMTQKSITDEMVLKNLSITQLQEAVLELQERQTIFVDYWNVEPIDPIVEQVWLVIEATTEGYIYINDEWLELPLSEKSVYIKRSDNTRYAWNGNEMVSSTFPLTKESIEALLTGVITSHSHNADANKLNATKSAIEALLTGNIYSHAHAVRTNAIPGYDIDLSAFEDFTKTCGTNSQFTISNPIIKKAFRLILTGGTLQVPTFSGYTVNWILTSLVTDYVPANTNYLWCEIRSANQIYCFWGA